MEKVDERLHEVYMWMSVILQTAGPWVAKPIRLHPCHYMHFGCTIIVERRGPFSTFQTVEYGRKMSGTKFWHSHRGSSQTLILLWDPHTSHNALKFLQRSWYDVLASECHTKIIQNTCCCRCCHRLFNYLQCPFLDWIAIDIIIVFHFNYHYHSIIIQ